MQGFNMGRYVPPDLEGTMSGNKLHKKHPLGSRANKVAQGILTVRFEMPFPVWCLTCERRNPSAPVIIGQGVRFNAEKQKVGNYHSTPIWAFRFKHADCGGPIEMRTDPKNTTFEVVSGARKRDMGDDDNDPAQLLRDGKVHILTDQERAKMRADAFGSLERTIEDREALQQAKERIDELAETSERRWEDPYARNQSLRRTFREGRKEREKDALETDALKDRMSLGIDLLPATEGDARRAALVDFGGPNMNVDEGVRKALSRPLFARRSSSSASSASGSMKRKDGLSAQPPVSSQREKLASEVVTNTRAARDPFLLPNGAATASATSTGAAGTQPRLSGVKRKREGNENEGFRGQDLDNPNKTTTILVEYDSD